MINKHITVGTNSYEKVKTFKYLGFLLTDQNSIHGEIEFSLKQEIRVIIQCKHFCLPDLSREF